MAQKKISELNSLLAVSGGAIIPIVAGDTTYKATVQQLKSYTDQGLALTSSISGSFTSLSSSITNRVTAVENSISSDNSLLNIFSSSVNTTTSSLIGITNGLMAFTAALDNTYATDVQLLPILQATASLNTYTSSQNLVNLGISIVTGSLNTYTSSQNLVNLGISEVTSSLNSYTSSNESWKDGVRGEVNGLEAYTASLKGAIEISGQDVNVLGMITAQQFNVTYVSSSTLYQSGSTKFGDTSDDRHEFTGSILVGGEVLGNSGLNQFTSSQNLVNLGISIVTGSLNSQTSSQDFVNLGISTFTGSIREEVNGLEEYTASLKGQAIVSSSTQITNYYKFAETASANTFYGNQTISGSLNVTSSVNLSGSVVINQLTYPTLNFADGQYGVEVPTLGVNNVFSMEVPKTVYEYVKNDSGITLPKGTPVHSTGTVGFNTLVIAASASNAATMPATFILAQDLDDEEEGLGIAIGSIQGIDTTGLTAGRPVYVGADGGFTQSKPTGLNLIQNLGIVTKVGVNGGGVVLGAGRSNDVPNIQQGYFWAGNSGSVATTFATSSILLANEPVSSSKLHISEFAKLTPQHPLPSGEAGMLMVSSSFGFTNLYMYDGSEWKWLVTGSIQ